MMNQCVRVLWSLVFGLFVQAQEVQQTKPIFVYPHLENPKIEGFKTQHACLIQQNIIPFLEHTYSTILPRVESEIRDLTRPHVVNGKKIFMAHTVDNADLFHFHIRYLTTYQAQSIEDLTNPQNYHLHYHSYEKLDGMKLGWLYQLQKLNDAPTSAWLNARLQEATAPVTSGSYGAGGQFSDPTPSPTKLTELNAAEVERLATLWDQHLGAKSPGLDYVRLWTHILNNPITSNALSEIYRYRSIASFVDRYDVIAGLDLPNIWQAADITFVPVAGNEDIAQAIESFSKRTHQKWVANHQGSLQQYIPARENLKADSIETFDKIFKLVMAKPDEKFILKSSLSKTFTTALMVQGQYIYSVHYNVAKYECP